MVPAVEGRLGRRRPWYRCDVVGGGEQSKEYVAPPTTAKGLLLGAEGRLAGVRGRSDGRRVGQGAVAQPHQWRAVTTISLGDQGDDYPGDRVVEVTTRDFCSKSVGAWLNPRRLRLRVHVVPRGGGEAGNRRSVCWARTDR